ncbi:MAG: methyl-accepting chemotaxis protein [Synergistaceae bacterium]|nr:methyl-accepting chemotaxis protein [Synergistaceae bacterium]
MMNKFRNMKIRTKLLEAFLLMSAIGIVLGATGIMSIHILTQKSKGLEKLQIESQEIMEALNSHYIWRQELTESVLLGSTFTGALDPQTCTFGRWLSYEKTKGITDEIILSLLKNIQASHELIHLEAGVLQDKSEDEVEKYLVRVILPKAHEVTALLTQIEGRYIELVNEKTNEVITTGKILAVLVVAFVVVAVMAGGLLSVLIPPAILKPLAALSSTMKKAADGDFSLRLSSDYTSEIGELFSACNALLETNDRSVMYVKEIVIKLRESAQDMLSISSSMAANSTGLKEQTSYASMATEEFSAGMTQSSSTLSTISSNISAVASSIEEINATISVVAAAAEQTSTVAAQSSALVDNIQNSISRASDSVSLVSNAFNNVAQSVDEINKSILVVSENCTVTRNKMSDADEKAKNTNMIIQRLEAASKQIGKIVGVISDVADQTNMLALNAAIEAAGAGEAGKGFMVVANEVKELARQTADATNEIADQIENMQNNVPEAVGAVSEITAIINEMTGFLNSFTQEITRQGKRSDQIANDSADAARRMSEITSEINRISENSLSVTKAVIESTRGTDEIAKSTAELVIGVQEIAMNSERASNNIREIDRATKEMASGVVDISRNIQFINEEAGTAQHSADAAKLSSGELLKTASDMEEFISRFKIT